MRLEPGTGRDQGWWHVPLESLTIGKLKMATVPAVGFDKRYGEMVYSTLGTKKVHHEMSAYQGLRLLPNTGNHNFSKLCHLCPVDPDTNKISKHFLKYHIHYANDGF